MSAHLNDVPSCESSAGCLVSIESLKHQRSQVHLIILPLWATEFASMDKCKRPAHLLSAEAIRVTFTPQRRLVGICDLQRSYWLLTAQLRNKKPFWNLECWSSWWSIKAFHMIYLLCEWKLFLNVVIHEPDQDVGTRKHGVSSKLQGQTVYRRLGSLSTSWWCKGFASNRQQSSCLWTRVQWWHEALFFISSCLLHCRSCCCCCSLLMLLLMLLLLLHRYWCLFGLEVNIGLRTRLCAYCNYLLLLKVYKWWHGCCCLYFRNFDNLTVTRPKELYVVILCSALDLDLQKITLSPLLRNNYAINPSKKISRNDYASIAQSSQK